MSRRFFALVLVALCPAMVSASELSEKAASLSPGEWVKLNTNFPDVIGGQDFVWSDSASWDSVNRQVNWICSPVGQDNYYHYRYDEITNTWSRVTTPHGVRSGHGYDVNTADNDGHIFYTRHGEGNVHRGTWNGNGYSWETLPDVNITPVAANSLSWADHLDGGRGGLIFVSGDGRSSWYKFSSPAGWQSPFTESVWGTPHPFSQYSPMDNVLWAGGGNNYPRVSKLLHPNGQWESMVDAPSGCDLRVNDSLHGYDPVSGRFLLLCDNDRWYEFDHRNGGRYTDITSSMTGRPQQAIYRGMAIVPIERYGVVMVIQGQGSGTASNPPPGVWIYKHSPGDPPPPPDDPPPAPNNTRAL